MISGCSFFKKNNSEEEKYSLNQPLSVIASYDEGYPLTETTVDETAAFKCKEYDDMKEYYGDLIKDKKSLPPFNFNVKLSNKTFNELRILRSEILARHGFLFMDYVLRSHFNATDWYKPVFWYKDFKIKLSDQEKAFMSKVMNYEQKLYTKTYITVNGQKKANLENLANSDQFINLPKQLKKHLMDDGFVINKSDHEQLFHIYDENYYDYTPSFITTDLFLQVMHMHISKEMQEIEETKLMAIIKEIVTKQYNASKNFTISGKTEMMKKAAEWNEVYFAVAVSLLNGQKVTVSKSMQKAYDYEYDHTSNAYDKGSKFLDDSLIDYTQFKPRGNYTRTPALKNYFKCVKWLNTASIYIDDDTRLSSAVLIAATFQQFNDLYKKYSSFSNIIQFLAGDENNLSLNHLTKILDSLSIKSYESYITKSTLQSIRESLIASDPKRMKPKGINDSTERFLARKKVLFTAGRYTFDAEILQRLIHIKKPNPKRVFPRGLDVFATMGNKTAENILINTFNESKLWKDYPDSLAMLQNKFSSFNEWNKSIYNKTMHCVLELQKPKEKVPYFMQSPNWQKKNLNTMLASWTELKHDMILYTEQPSGAEMGDGGEIPPPQKIAYVEPQLEFWKRCLDLLVLNKKRLNANGLMSEHLESINRNLEEVLKLFIAVSEKELNGQKVSNKEFDDLSFIGGLLESLTLTILKSTEMTTTSVTTPERYVAVAADVYTYKNNCLEETVGMADEIYVVAEINGLLYLTRGAVFSHYEFTQPSSSRLTDEEWQSQLLKHKEPAREPWMNDILIGIPKVKTNPKFNLY